MTSKDRALIYHQKIVGNLMFRNADFNYAYIDSMDTVGRVIVSKISIATKRSSGPKYVLNSKFKIWRSFMTDEDVEHCPGVTVQYYDI